MADGHTQGSDGSFGVEVEETQKILMLEIAFRLQTAAGHHSVGDTYRGGTFESHLNVEIIIRLQKAPVNDAEKVLLIIPPVFRRKLFRNLFQLVGKAVFAGNSVPAFQSGGYGLLVFRAVLPQPGAAGVLFLAGVRYVKHIAYPVLSGAGVDEGDTLGPLHHIPAHLLTPQVVIGAGGGVRALGVN